VNETTGTTPAAAPLQAPIEGHPADTGGQSEEPSFGARGRARRRARFLRKARELAYRDLGGLVFNLHRFGQRNDALVLAKLSTLGTIDSELRTLESALQERQTVTILREAGITACPRCAAIHGGEDRFCPNCGLPMTRHVDLPIAGAPAAAGPPAAGAAASQAPAPAPSASPPSAPAPAPAAPAPVAQALAVSAPDPRATPGAAPTPARVPPAAEAPADAAAQAPAVAAAGRSPAPPVTAIKPPDPAPGEPAGTPPAPHAPTSPGSEEQTEVLRPREAGR
jgi:hypothetical protein